MCCHVALHLARHTGAPPGGLPRCCGNLGENQLAFTLEFCIISGSKFERLLAPLDFQTLQMPAMGTEEWKELQRPGMEGGQHPCRPGGDRHPDLPTLRRELRSRDLTDEVLPLLGPWVAFEAPSLWAQSPSCFHYCVNTWSFYSKFTYSKHNKSPEYEA